MGARKSFEITCVLMFSTVFADKYYQPVRNFGKTMDTFQGFPGSGESDQLLLPSSGTAFGTSQASSQAGLPTTTFGNPPNRPNIPTNICALCYYLGNSHCIHTYCQSFGRRFRPDIPTNICSLCYYLGNSHCIRKYCQSFRSDSRFRPDPNPPNRPVIPTNICSLCYYLGNSHCIRKYCQSLRFGRRFRPHPSNNVNYNYYTYGPRSKSY